MIDIGSAKGRYMIGATAFMVGLFFNIAETWYFGWNVYPSCPAEIQRDYISKVLLFSGFLIVVYVNTFQKGSEKP